MQDKDRVQRLTDGVRVTIDFTHEEIKEMIKFSSEIEAIIESGMILDTIVTVAIKRIIHPIMEKVRSEI